jgi:hypothetical protein
MTASELTELQKAVAEALAIYGQNKDPLSATEISIKSMLVAVRLQLAEKLKQTPLDP